MSWIAGVGNWEPRKWDREILHLDLKSASIFLGDSDNEHQKTPIMKVPISDIEWLFGVCTPGTGRLTGEKCGQLTLASRSGCLKLRPMRSERHG